MFETLPTDGGITRTPPTFVKGDAAATDDDYLSRMVDMGDPPQSAYEDWQYLTAQESRELEAQLLPPLTVTNATGAWLLSAADPTRVNWQKYKWWGSEDAHLH